MKPIILIGFVLAACGSSGGGSSQPPAADTATTTQTAAATATSTSTSTGTGTATGTTTTSLKVSDVVSALNQIVVKKSLDEQPAAVKTLLANSAVKFYKLNDSGASSGFCSKGGSDYRATIDDGTSKVAFVVEIEGLTSPVVGLSTYTVDQKPAVNQNISLSDCASIN